MQPVRRGKGESGKAEIRRPQNDVPSQAFVFKQFRAVRDMHPDAHACRLKLSLALQYSENKVMWDVISEYGGYLAKLCHVSAACRLTHEEEIDVMHSTKSGTPMIKNRSLYIEACVENEPAVKLSKPPMPVGGEPWLTMQLYNPPAAARSAPPPPAPRKHVLVLAARTLLNAIGQPRATLSLRPEHSRAARGATAGGKGGPKLRGPI